MNILKAAIKMVFGTSNEAVAEDYAMELRRNRRLGQQAVAKKRGRKPYTHVDWDYEKEWRMGFPGATGSKRNHKHDVVALGKPGKHEPKCAMAMTPAKTIKIHDFKDMAPEEYGVPIHKAHRWEPEPKRWKG